MQREPIYAALFALVAAAAGIKTSSRRIKSFADTAAGDTPAVFMEQKKEQSVVGTNMPGKWSLHVDLVVLVNTGGNDPNVIPTTVLNPIIDDIVTKLVPPAPLPEQNLGGLVTRCRVDGTIEIVEGAQGDQALAIIPVVVFTPD